MTDNTNPWAGLASYEDPATAERKLKFCGRDDDSYDLARLIMGNVFVTLYGKSGIGKTSLLNAGVFPELREEPYTPVNLRLGIRDDEKPKSYQTMILEAIECTVKRIETFNVIAEQQDQQAINYLWNYFARHRFYDKNDEPTTPVIAFDQFEEVFRGHRDEAEILLKQLDYINDKDHALDRCEIDGQSYRYERTFRFVVSIREDDLYLLEDSIDNCYLPALKRCRYRLRSLSEDGARDAILIPGKGLFNPNEEDTIAKSIISKSRNEDGSISTDILSLLCSRIYADYKKTSANHISTSIVDNFLKGNPFERFYNEAIRGFSDREKSYIEDNFVDSTGRRNSIPESDFLKNVPNGAALLKGDTRIMQRTSTSSDGKSNRIELIHDSFCEPLSIQKEKRERRKRLLQLGLACLIAIISAVAVFYMWNINHRMRITESRVIAEKASALVDQGDSYLARLLALEALPPNRPYTVEAESALRKAWQHGNAILRGHTSYVYDASFSPDGQYIVSASWDSTIRIWNVKTGLQVGEPLKHSSWVHSAYFWKDRKIISADYDGTLREWDTETGQCSEPIYARSVQISQYGIIALEYNNSSVKIWDSNADQQEGITLKRHSLLTRSPDSKYIITTSNNDHTIWIWDAKTGKQVGRKLKGHNSQVLTASLSPDYRYIVSASQGHSVRIWDVKDGQQVGSISVKGGARTANYSPDGKYIVTANNDHTVSIWDAKTGAQIGKPLEGHTNDVESAYFSPDGKHIVSASSDKTVRIWDVDSIQLVSELLLVGYPQHSFFTTFSPDYRYIVSSPQDPTIRIWDAKTGLQVGDPLVGHTENVISASFSPDGKYIVSASRDNTVRIWDAKTGLQVGAPLVGHTNDVFSASFSPDGRYIVSAALDSTIRIWNAKTGLQVGEPLVGHTDVVISASFSPDGKYIVSASVDKTVRIWDAKTGLQEGDPFVGHTNSVKYASFSPDGKYIVSSSWDKTVRIWDAKTGLQVGDPLDDGHTYSVSSVSFSPDGRYIVSESYDEVRIWDTKTGLQMGDPIVEHRYINSATFSPDGRYIATVTWDGTVKMWDFPSLQELIDSTTEQFKNRPLTPEERKKYYLD